MKNTGKKLSIDNICKIWKMNKDKGTDMSEKDEISNENTISN